MKVAVSPDAAWASHGVVKSRPVQHRVSLTAAGPVRVTETLLTVMANPSTPMRFQ